MSTMSRTDWLKTMRLQAEALYDKLSPAYWVTYGMYANETHRQFIEKFLEKLQPHSDLLDAACGAGRYDGILSDAGHSVLGVDQSGGMLARAREALPQDRYPRLRYAKVGLQEIDFKEQFDGIICIDALEHVCPEDWPGIARRLGGALKTGGALYVTVEVAEPEHVREAYERARASGLPVVPGEVADQVDPAYQEVKSLDWQSIPGARAAVAVYHYYPDSEQVRAWLNESGLIIEAEGTAEDYWHILARKLQR